MARIGLKWCPHCKRVLEAGFVNPDGFRMGPRAVTYCRFCDGEIVLQCEWPEMNLEMRLTEVSRLLLPALILSGLTLAAAVLLVPQPVLKTYYGLFAPLGLWGVALGSSPLAIAVSVLFMKWRIRRSIARFEEEHAPARESR